MTEEDPLDAGQDEIVFSAKYSPGRVSVALTISCLFIYWCHVYLLRGFTYDLSRDIYEGIVAGGQGLSHFLLLAPILLLLLLPLIPLVLELLCFKKIIFYPNRVEIVRRLFRTRIVFYSSGTVKRGRLFSGYLIEEAVEKGRSQQSRFLYDFQLFFFHSEAGRKIGTIFNYLTGDSPRKNPRAFKRSILPGVLSLK